MTTAAHSAGTTLKYDPVSNPSAPVYSSTFGYITKIGEWDLTQKVVEVTHLLSTGKWKEKIPGFRDAGKVPLMVLWEKGQYQTWQNIFNTAPTNPGSTFPIYLFKMIFPTIGSETTASFITFTGFVSKLGLDVPEDDKIGSPVELELTGAIAWTAGS